MNIGDRIKKYEEVSFYKLLPNNPVIIRVDGKAFHTFTKNMSKPFDHKLIEAMINAGIKTSKEMMGFVLGYHQSDEFTFYLIDTNNYKTEAWFNNEIQKLASITASMFTAYFNEQMGGTKAVFDARAFNVPDGEVPNVFIWRQRDWERNSLQMYSRTFFSHKELENKNKDDMHEMLHQKGKNWSKLHKLVKNGTFITGDGDRICEKMDYNKLKELCTKKL